jgi:hypothetical protein
MAPRKKKEEEVVVDETKYLSESDMRQMETANAQIREAEAAAKLAAKDVEIVKLRTEIMKLKISEMERELKSKKEALAGAQASYKAFTEVLRNKHDLSYKWGYDPFTGEIEES